MRALWNSTVALIPKKRGLILIYVRHVQTVHSYDIYSVPEIPATSVKLSTKPYQVLTMFRANS